MYQIDLHTIRFTNGRWHRFSTEIAEAMDFEESIIVRLTLELSPPIQNIFGLDYSGHLLWKIPAPRSFVALSPYVSLIRRGMFLEALNWDGHLLMLHPKEGWILSESFSGEGPARHRVASSRHWM